MTRLPRHTDVLIVGAGPAGLALAVTLAQLGIDHVIIDSKSAASPGTKAAAVQPRSLEYLDRVGLAETLIADGLRGGRIRRRRIRPPTHADVLRVDRQPVPVPLADRSAAD